MVETSSSMPLDAVLICRDCGAQFSLSEDEREAFLAQGLVHPPSRCATCREARKTRQAESGARVAPPGFRELRDVRTKVRCSLCGAAAEVPFAPRPGRPVYCVACFQQRRSAEA